MPKKLSYADLGDACRAANALDLVGDRWTLILARELILGPKRFADLQDAARGITPAVLTDRLRALRQAGIIEQIVLQDLARTRAYVATDWGRGLEQVLQSLGKWYSAGPHPETTGGMTPDAVVIAMRTMAPPTAKAIPPIALRLYDTRRANPPTHDYQLSTHDGALAIHPGAPANPAATITADSTTWQQVLFGTLPLRKAERAGTLHIAPDHNAITPLIALYT